MAIRLVTRVRVGGLVSFTGICATHNGARSEVRRLALMRAGHTLFRLLPLPPALDRLCELRYRRSRASSR